MIRSEQEITLDDILKSKPEIKKNGENNKEDEGKKLDEKLKKKRQSARLKKEEELGYKKSENIAKRASIYEKNVQKNLVKKTEEHKK